LAFLLALSARSRERRLRARVYAVLLTALVSLGAESVAHADIKDYEFQLVDKEVKKGHAILSVRLVHKPNGELVRDAVIFATRLDMAPDDMEKMTATIEPAPSTDPGIYRFSVDLMAEGRWRLSLAAKVQGETGAVKTRLVLKALP
jgi:YtkA-like